MNIVSLAEVYQEETGSTFTHNGINYNLNELLKQTEFLDINYIPIDQLDWIFEYDSPYEEKERISQADTSYPILVIWNFEDSHSKLVVIDGLHRVAKAKANNQLSILGQYVSEEMLEKCIIDTIVVDNTNK